LHSIPFYRSLCIVLSTDNLNIDRDGVDDFEQVDKMPCASIMAVNRLFLFQDVQPLAKYIAALDPRYNSLFMDNVWKEAFEHSDTAVGM